MSKILSSLPLSIFRFRSKSRKVLHRILNTSEQGYFIINNFNLPPISIYPFSLSRLDKRTLVLFNDLSQNNRHLENLIFGAPILRAPTPFQSHGLQLLTFEELGLMIFVVLDLDCSLRSLNFFLWENIPSDYEMALYSLITFLYGRFFCRIINHLAPLKDNLTDELQPISLPSMISDPLFSLRHVPLLLTISIHQMDYTLFEIERVILSSLLGMM